MMRRTISVAVRRASSSQRRKFITPKQIEVISQVFHEKLEEKFKTLSLSHSHSLLTRQQLEAEDHRTNLSLLDLNSFLQSTISFSSAQRQKQLSTLSALLQQTLDSVQEGLDDLRGDLQTSGKALHSSTHRQQRLEGELQRREGALGIALGEFRTRSEAVKLRAIYTFTMGIAGLFLAIVIESSRKRRDRAASKEKPDTFSIKTL